MAGATDIRAGLAYVELYLQDNRLTRGLAAAGKRLRAFGSIVSGFGAKIAGLGAAGIADIGAMVKQAVEMGSQLADMSQRTGMSVESLSELGYAADQSGASLESLEASTKKMQKVIDDAASGSESAAGDLEDLGLSVDELKNLDPESQFLAVAEALSKIEDPTERAAKAMKVFGKSGTDLLPLVNEGAAGIERLRERARELGLTVSTEDATALESLGDVFSDLWKTVKMGVFQVGAALAPTLSDLAQRIISVIGTVVGWMKLNRGLIVSIASLIALVTGIGGAIVGIGGAISLVGFSLSGIAGAIGLAGKAFGLLRFAMLPVTAAMTALRVVMVAMRAIWAATAAAMIFLKTSTMATSVVVLAAKGIWAATTATLAMAKAAILGVASASKIAALGMSIFSAVTGAIGAVLGFLTSPIAIIVAGLAAIGFIAFRAVGGLSGIANAGKSAASWLSDTASTIVGKLVGAFNELLKIGTQTFKGIMDALATGDFATAGKVAMAGLKLAMLTGVQALSQAVGGAFGQFLGTFTQQLLGGDFAGAWGTVVKSMGAIWDQFVSGIVNAFASAAKAISKLWVGMQKGISDFILEDASKGGIFGKLGLLGTGVDMSTEQGKAEADRLGKIAATERNLEQARKALERAEKGGGKATLKEGDAGGLEHTVEELRNLIQNYEKDIASWGATQVNVLGEAQEAAREQLDSSADRIASVVDDLAREAEERADQSADDLKKKGVAGIDDEAINAAQAELDELTKSLAEASKATKEAAKTAAESTGKAAMKLTDKIAGTFSANAAARLSGGNNYAKNTADNTAKADKKLGKTNKLLDDIKKKTGLIPIGNN